MASTQLHGMRVAILVTDDFEQSELTEPKKALQEAGAKALIVSPKPGEVQGMNHDEKADRFPVDQSLAEADPEQRQAAGQPGETQGKAEQFDQQGILFVLLVVVLQGLPFLAKQAVVHCAGLALRVTISSQG